MYKGKQILAIIPARGGSKGIPRKNIIPIHNKPLIQYTIDEALLSNYLDEIIVSTDDKEIAQISINLGANVPYLRPEKLAQDHSRTIDTVMHVVEKQKERGYNYDYVVVLQPTQPLRKHWHIDEAIESVINNNHESLVSVTKVKEHPILMRTINKNNKLENIINKTSTLRRQDFPEVYKVNGAIYINNTATLHSNTSLNDNKYSYIMEEKFDLDIDDLKDVELFYDLYHER
ncbi:MAG: cytidylyltransferase domain-containing protein [Bacillota bacterium]|uniref:Acylneuraminate cytidylyltransferase family protein n=1 Tax=Virgibacillus salarius TaxID=447199 RepID=A0A941DX37_9BACI|nr:MULTISPECIES: acylneuraminate cytidylyltransferase family protein [Virgibacillus]NAZ09760.1 acylneuraminate cytidylyltransferase family protein [Agaribacter marinus]MBR7797051.1 acylneuraminate cytidylyltransferase family protein [Virgibacillus salarius]MCC2250748.1 acylneuraminate cytidylyltransferase family protein [Virgibacillus sp. AGTR]MDY7042828.1 acylneuraminate cytidylyltransferase family protein [Virgibacillus sp. M23]QRZ18076.1 acylneuraminate cytidylyltransferase family protein [